MLCRLDVLLMLCCCLHVGIHNRNDVMCFFSFWTLTICFWNHLTRTPRTTLRCYLWCVRLWPFLFRFAWYYWHNTRYIHIHLHIHVGWCCCFDVIWCRRLSHVWRGTTLDYICRQGGVFYSTDFSSVVIGDSNTFQENSLVRRSCWVLVDLTSKFI